MTPLISIMVRVFAGSAILSQKVVMSGIYQCAGESWSPTIGDPTALGWITTVAYFVAALLASFALRVAPSRRAAGYGAYVQFWWLMIVSFAFLGLNKQLDLQSLSTVIARCLAIRDGWYADRRHFQMLFIVAAVTGGGLLLLGAAVYFRKAFKLVWMAAIGVVFVVTFVIVRAASFHHVDQILGSHVLGMRINGLLELTGIAFAAFNAFWLAFIRPVFTQTKEAGSIRNAVE